MPDPSNYPVQTLQQTDYHAALVHEDYMQEEQYKIEQQDRNGQFFAWLESKPYAAAEFEQLFGNELLYQKLSEQYKPK